MTRTILLADDSVTIQKVVELTFLDEDFHVVCYGNGGDAIDHLGELRPDLVLADVHMPGADGYEVCVATKQLFPTVPVLLLVGTFEIFDAGKASDSGAQGHLKKPFDSQELLRRVKELLEGTTATAAAEAANWSMPLEGTAPKVADTASEPEGDDWSFEPIGEEGFDLERGASATSEPAAMATLPELDTTAGFTLPESEEAMEVAPAPAEHRSESVVEPEPAMASAAAPAVGGPLSDDDVDRIARRVVELLGERVVRDVAWDVVPDLAELLVKERIRELEASVE
jgi:CheY-like chemotaxis protein